MIAQLQQRKFEQHFDRYDRNGDEVIDQSDIDGLVQGWCVGFGVQPGSEQWRRVTKLANRFWQMLDGHLDADGDKVITKEEWVAAHDNPDFVEKVAMPLAQATFELGDTDEDGRVSLNEWMTLQACARVGQIEALEAFQALDNDGDGFVTADEHAAAIREFYLSTDANSAGNRLAGRI
ncbi:EF-hand domain-containing protein [Saccharothrix sp. NRRL B-16314]|uniref:EF-hand domain-containing protein n=1 Tax=Saccharothrix sp. NRRL B-16314 TaxID=1463825 RepID=UPI000525325B|nr:EF-hand domain-containing protein [Saccharothrix sp. NRRL B-16314]